MWQAFEREGKVDFGYVRSGKLSGALKVSSPSPAFERLRRRPDEAVRMC